MIRMPFWHTYRFVISFLPAYGIKVWLSVAYSFYAEYLICRALRVQALFLYYIHINMVERCMVV